ncbi:MAG: regulator [Flavobacteriales bacterium]|nr:regulator [Flavobacteriales bacterium]
MKWNCEVLMVAMVIASCNEAEKTPWPVGGSTATRTAPAQPDSASVANPPDTTEQISQYIRRMFQDRDGSIWFGTEQDGVVRYDGRKLEYFTPIEGFSGTSVRGMAQDAQGNMWFATRGGVARFDGRRFTRWSAQDGLADDQVWCVLVDRSGGLWFGTDGGVSRFDGRSFTPFAIPVPAAHPRYHPSTYPNPKLINAMIQDRAGNIWFGTNGNGAYRYDGKALTNLSEKDGLCNNFVQSILEDRHGNLWFGTRFGGLSEYDPGTSAGPKAFTTFTKKDGLTGDLIWTLYEDRAGIIWISTTYAGACSYNGTRFTCYQRPEGLDNSSVHSILEDASGQLWVGTANGVYRFDGMRFSNWTKRDALRRQVRR